MQKSRSPLSRCRTMSLICSMIFAIELLLLLLLLLLLVLSLLCVGDDERHNFLFFVKSPVEERFITLQNYKKRKREAQFGCCFSALPIWCSLSLLYQTSRKRKRKRKKGKEKIISRKYSMCVTIRRHIPNKSIANLSLHVLLIGLFHYLFHI